MGGPGGGFYDLSMQRKPAVVRAQKAVWILPFFVRSRRPGHTPKLAARKDTWVIGSGPRTVCNRSSPWTLDVGRGTPTTPPFRMSHHVHIIFFFESANYYRGVRTSMGDRACFFARVACLRPISKPLLPPCHAPTTQTYRPTGLHCPTNASSAV